MQPAPPPQPLSTNPGTPQGPSASPFRNDKVASAVRFLKHPNVRTSTIRARMIFLEKKGLTSSEIAEALRQVDPNSAEYGLVAAGVAEGIKASEAVAGSDEGELKGAGSEILGVESSNSSNYSSPSDAQTRARLNRLSAQVSQLAEAQENNASWWKVLVPASLIAAGAAGIGYLFHHYFPRITITIGSRGTAGKEEAKQQGASSAAKADAPSNQDDNGDSKSLQHKKGKKKRRRKRGTRHREEGGWEDDDDLDELGDDAYDDDDDDEDDEDDDKWRKLDAAGEGNSTHHLGGTHKSGSTAPSSFGPSKEDFQRLKSEIDHISDELAINSRATANVLEEIRDALQAMREDSASGTKSPLSSPSDADGAERKSNARTSTSSNITFSGAAAAAAAAAGGAHGVGGGAPSQGDFGNDGDDSKRSSLAATMAPPPSAGGAAAAAAAAKSVEEAVVQMRESNAGNAKLAVSYLKFFVNKIKQDPNAGKLNKQNSTVRKIIEVEGGSEFLRLAGFQNEEHVFVYKPPEDLKEREAKLNKLLDLLNNFETVEVPPPPTPPPAAAAVALHQQQHQQESEDLVVVPPPVVTGGGGSDPRVIRPDDTEQPAEAEGEGAAAAPVETEEKANGGGGDQSEAEMSGGVAAAEAKAEGTGLPTSE